MPARSARLACLAALLLPLAAHAQGVTVFAAASLTDVMKDIAKAWQAQGHPAPRFSFAASSTLARQIEQGAPANLFASADEQWMDYLARRDLIVPARGTTCCATIWSWWCRRTGRSMWRSARASTWPGCSAPTGGSPSAIPPMCPPASMRSRR